MNNSTNNYTKESLMQELRALSFAALETGMYLDMYPDNRAALHYFDECRNRVKELTELYEERYGGLTMLGAAKNGSWDWNDGPMPWQKES